MAANREYEQTDILKCGESGFWTTVLSLHSETFVFRAENVCSKPLLPYLIHMFVFIKKKKGGGRGKRTGCKPEEYLPRLAAQPWALGGGARGPQLQ